MPSETAPSDGASDFTRLHISPLDPDLLKIVLPATVAAQARNISYHSIDTFPERRYGYVELPSMEADKLKKKLNGSVLKGTKLRVEKARPEHRMEPTGEQDQERELKKSKTAKKASDAADASRKRKRDRDVVEGVAISDRKIKRGWSEPADQRRKKSRKDKEKEKDKDTEGGGPKTAEKKKRQKSKYTDGEECLLKTKLPPNAVGNLTEDNMPKKRKKKGNAREVVVHEFEKTTRFPSFLKTVPEESQSNGATEFVEGKGWVDSEGSVVEAVKTKPAPAPAVQKPKRSKPSVKVVEEDDSTSSGGTSSSESSDEESDEDPAAESKPAPKKEKVEATQDHETSDSSDSDSDSGDEPPVQASHTTPKSTIKADHSRPMSASSTRSLTIKIPPPITPSASSKVHPLEALYKRPKANSDANAVTSTPAQEPQPFSFFGEGGDDVEEEEDNEHPNPTVPMTPYTRQDLEWRNTRSAAPTPDTAHPTRMRNFWAEDEDANMHDVEEEEEEDAEAPPQPSSSQGATSEFQSWFWDNRRDLNRSWMSRRKTVAKEKRHRENKARASKAV